MRARCPAPAACLDARAMLSQGCDRRKSNHLPMSQYRDPHEPWSPPKPLPKPEPGFPTFAEIVERDFRPPTTEEIAEKAAFMARIAADREARKADPAGHYARVMEAAERVRLREEAAAAERLRLKAEGETPR